MAISPHSQNKFAFLFTGSADPQYVADLRRVTETLIKFYRYPATNIKVVAGAAVAAFTPSVPPDPNNIFETSGLNPQVLSGPSASEFKTDLSDRIDAFMVSLDHEIVGGYENSAFFYFTGVGEKDTSGPTPDYRLIIAGSGANIAKINQVWLKGLLVSYSEFIAFNHINILMQQSFSYGFFEAQNGLSSISSVGVRLTFSSACNSGETIDADANGSSFTKDWTNALQFATRSAANIYADQEDTATTSPPDPVSEDTGNYLISVKKAWRFARALSNKTPMFDFRGGISLDYLGLPVLIIHDGSPNYYESPDIKVVHPSVPGASAAQYLYDSGGSVRNIISVHVELQGTHPVRSFCINLGIYRSSEQVSVDEPPLKPDKIVTGLWKPLDPIPDQDFTGLQFLYTDYNCIVARASLECNDTFAGIDPAGNEFEAQRNIMMYEEDFLCSVSHRDESSVSAADGQITIVASGGVPFPSPSPHYEYNIGGGSYGLNGSFNSLTGGTHTVGARDSTTHTCSQTVDLTHQNGGVQQCQQLLDNDYIHICRTTSGSLRCTFKPFPELPEGYYRTRGYKIRWKPPVPHPVTPAIPPSDIIEFHNVTVVESGLDHIGGSYRPYLIIRVVDNRTGEILLKYPKPGIVTDGQRLTVPVKIYFRRIFGIWPPLWWRWPWYWDWRWPWDWRLSWPWRWPYRWRWPWLWPIICWQLIARFRLIIVPHMYDIEEF